MAGPIHVVVVGGGFAGLNAAKTLAGQPVRVTLIDRQNHHLFQPLLYQVATAGLSPADIARPIRSVLRDQDNARVLLDEVTDIDVEHRTVQLREGPLPYDWLVLAAGAGNAYFGNDHWRKHAPGLKSVEDALSIRRRVLLAYERAENGAAEALNFVVVGGGPTGVELAGALREIASETIPADFRNVDTRSARIVLIEGADRLLPAMSEAASEAALKALKAMDVEVRLSTRVTDIDAQGVSLGEERLPASNVIWAAGVKASGLGQALGTPLDRSGRVQVEPDCSVPGHPEVFVIGDMAALTDANGVPVPGVAQGALQMGDHVAAIVRGEPRSPFAYYDKGSMATIGRARAVADVFGGTWKGLPAWVLWSAVHIAFLVGFRNKVFVMLSWLWSYVRNGRGARLITEGH